MTGKEAGGRQAAQAHKELGGILKPHLEEALVHRFAAPRHGPIHYADFGCGSGSNALSYAKFVAEVLKTKVPDADGREVVCHFADLPANNFNALLNLLPSIGGQGGSAAEERTWFVSGVPGSQYGRMFPRASLNVAISTLSLHFLPEVPESALDKSSPAYNKGYIGIHGTSPVVAEAFAEASRSGLRTFFECRAEEMAPGGVLAFFCCGREDHAHPENQYPDDSIVFVPHIEKAWQELVREGVIAEELLDSFNVASFNPSVEEIEAAIAHPDSAFKTLKLEFIPEFRPFPENAGETMFRDADSFANVFSGMMRSAMGPKITLHLGPELADALFQRIRENSVKDYPKWRAGNFFTLSLCLAVLVRKGDD